MSVGCLAAGRRRRNLEGSMITDETFQAWCDVFSLSVSADDDSMNG